MGEVRAIQAAYRAVLRAQRTAFRGDHAMQRAVVDAMREQFRAAPKPGTTLDERLAEAHDAAAFIRSNVVQATLNQRGNYELNVSDIRTDK